ncbi:TIGR01777 family oxidoreductase [Serratia microhaemolytica]|uniref:TIGR01777 family oxidoreductase n=1 Tax=Serratia microhaemolytica TaxID=2675110 RepID=UPI000FDED94C|nr:TIGR01777 family oxidoreductase [Serratia microhaemolytica]
MNILITGATGLIGSYLVPQLLHLGHQLTVLTRDVSRARSQFADRVNYCAALEQLTLNGFDAVINLAGEPIAAKRWSQQQKQKLCDSRWQITERLSQMIIASDSPPSVFISASAIGYYGDQNQRIVTEESVAKQEFTHQLCQRWEELARQAQSSQTRVCLLRTGIVLATTGGALAKMLPLFRLGLGGRIGNGRQYLPWIHWQDMVNGIIYLLTQPELSGAFNMVAPTPVQNRHFSRILALVLHRPLLLPVPAFAIRLLMGEAALLLLTGQRALPNRLKKSGFNFRFTNLTDALEQLLK